MNKKTLIRILKRSKNFFFEALRATYAAKLRTLLSAICIGIGIAGVTLVAALGVSASQKATELLDMFGSDAIMIFSGNQKKMAAGMRSMTLTTDDIIGLRTNFPDAYIVAPLRARNNVLVSYNNANVVVEVFGTAISSEAEWDWKIAIGRDINLRDNEFSSNVCVIGSFVNETLFSGENPIGHQIKVGKHLCEVVGVSVKKSFGSVDNDLNSFVMIPDTVFAKKYAWRKDLFMGLRMRFIDPKTIDNYIEPVTEYLRYNHNLMDDEENDFEIFTASQISAMIIGVMTIIGGFLGVITLVVVVVGGFVMANMFLLATQSRINEIGIKRAFGATSKDIFTQFIIEFILVTFIGMFLGLALGFIATSIISSYTFIEIRITPMVFIITAVVSMIIALTFGILPAKSAANIKPIEAIRSL